MKTAFPTEVPPGKSFLHSLVKELIVDDMLPEYDINYSKARPNRFTRREAIAKTTKINADKENTSRR